MKGLCDYSVTPETKSLFLLGTLLDLGWGFGLRLDKNVDTGLVKFVPQEGRGEIQITEYLPLAQTLTRVVII